MTTTQDILASSREQFGDTARIIVASGDEVHPVMLIIGPEPVLDMELVQLMIDGGTDKLYDVIHKLLTDRQASAFLFQAEAWAAPLTPRSAMMSRMGGSLGDLPSEERREIVHMIQMLRTGQSEAWIAEITTDQDGQRSLGEFTSHELASIKSVPRSW